MAKLNLTRRTFVKAMAATAAAAACTSQVAGTALADTQGASTSTEVKRVRTCCRGCGKMECGVWVTVENGRAACRVR